MNIIKKYLSKKPKNFWRWAFVYLLIFQYFSPYMVVYILLPFGLGLAAPQANFTQGYEIAAETLVDTQIYIMQIMTDTGQGIGTNNPILSKIIFFGISHQVWVIYIGLIWVIGHILRFIIYRIFYGRKEQENEHKQSN